MSVDVLEHDRPPARRRWEIVAGVLVLLALVAAAVWQRVEPAPPAVEPALPVAEPVPGPPPFVADQVVARAADNGVEFVAVARPANASEASSGGKAVEILTRGDRPEWTRLTDYLSYDLFCLDDDVVCAEVQPSGLGFYIVIDRPGVRSYVFAQAPAGRTVEAVLPDRTHPLPDAATGAVTEITPFAAGASLRVRVTLPDGRTYRLPEQPGARIG